MTCGDELIVIPDGAPAPYPESSHAFILLFLDSGFARARRAPRNDGCYCEPSSSSFRTSEPHFSRSLAR